MSLLATLVTPVRAMREFAWLSLVGILVAFGAAVTVTPALLLAFGRPRGLRARSASPPPPTASRASRAATARFVVRRRTRGRSGAFALVLVGCSPRLARAHLDRRRARASARLAVRARLRRAEPRPRRRDLVPRGGRRGLARARFAASREPARARDARSAGSRRSRRSAAPARSPTGSARCSARRAAASRRRARAARRRAARIGGQLLLLGRGDEQNELIDAALAAREPGRAHAARSRPARSARWRARSRRASPQLPAPLHGARDRSGDRVPAPVGRRGRCAAQSLVLSLGGRVRDPLDPVPLAARRAARARAEPDSGRVLLRACSALAGVPLTLATSVGRPIALGFALNDTMHYFVRFAIEARRLADEEAATVRALVDGRPAR